LNSDTLPGDLRSLGDVREVEATVVSVQQFHYFDEVFSKDCAIRKSAQAVWSPLCALKSAR
jgi:hypothetical protein